MSYIPINQLYKDEYPSHNFNIIFLDHKSRRTFFNAPLPMIKILNWGQLSVRCVSKFDKFHINDISVELLVIEDTLNGTHVMYLTGECY